MRRRERCAGALVERRHQHVRGHDRRDAVGDRRAERHQLDRVEPPAIVIDDRQRLVRIDAGVAVAGKVLAARRDAGCLQRADDRRAEPRHVVGAVGEARDRR